MGTYTPEPVEEPLKRVPMSWEEFLELPDRPRHEWVDGETVFLMSPARVAHGRAVYRLCALLVNELPSLDGMTEVGWKMRRSHRVPDLMLVEAPAPDVAYLSEPPVVVVEVVSPSTRREDLVRKNREYAEGGALQYWVVDLDARALEVYESTGDGYWETRALVERKTPEARVKVREHGTVHLRFEDVFGA
ncbi:Uma2 family endonuclease [Nocardioides sp. AN3]